MKFDGSPYDEGIPDTCGQTDGYDETNSRV